MSDEFDSGAVDPLLAGDDDELDPDALEDAILDGDIDEDIAADSE